MGSNCFIRPTSKQNIGIIASSSEKALLEMFFGVYANETARETQNRVGGIIQNNIGFRLVHIRYTRIGHAILNEQKFVPANRGGTQVLDDNGKILPEILADLKKCVILYSGQVEAWSKKTDWSYELGS